MYRERLSRDANKTAVIYTSSLDGTLEAMLQAFKAKGKVRNQSTEKRAKPPNTQTLYYGTPARHLMYKDVITKVKERVGVAPTTRAMDIGCGMADSAQFRDTRQSICDSKDAVEWENFSAKVVSIVSDTLMDQIAQKEASQREQEERNKANKDATVSFWREVAKFNDNNEGSKLSKKQVQHFLGLSGLPVPGKGSTPVDDLTEALAALARLYRLKPVIAKHVAQALLLTKDHLARFGIQDIQEAVVLAEKCGKTALHWSHVDLEALQSFDEDKDLEADLRTERVDFEVNRRVEACGQLAREQKQVDGRRETIIEIVNTANNLFFGDAAKMTNKKRTEIFQALLADHELDVAEQTARARWEGLALDQQELVDSIWEVLDDGNVLASERGAVIDSIKKFPKAEQLADELAAATQLRLYQALGASTPVVRAGTTEVRMDIDIATIARAVRDQSPVRDAGEKIRDAREKIRRSRSRSQSQSPIKDQA